MVQVSNAKLAKRICGCGCERTFQPTDPRQTFINKKHSGRARQKSLRERAKLATQMMKEKATV